MQAFYSGIQYNPLSDASTSLHIYGGIEKCPVTMPEYQLIMECRSSGLTDFQWCKEHGIHPETFGDIGAKELAVQ